MMEDFFMKMNYDGRFRRYPIVCYHGFYQRRIGCLGAADRSLYIDPDGGLHPCPFCRISSGSALSSELESTLFEMKHNGCPVFGHSKLTA
jgi:MoaA/NifB/PqqE/SkfB family radical SAM enzyme